MLHDRNELSDRKKLILKAVIDAHIEGGEPVGSKYLTQSKHIPFSSATIRNEMSELEELGYLEQPHTSAGRIPSELGYRFYVDALMQSYDMTARELAEIGKLLKAKAAQLDKILETAGRLMGAITNYTALTVRGKPDSAQIARFKTMTIDRWNLILVMIFSADTIKTKYVNLNFEINEETARSLEIVLNRNLAGIPLNDITLPLIMKMEAELGADGDLIQPVIKQIYDALRETGGAEVFIDGVNRLLEYPEFTDLNKLRGLIGVLEKKEDILGVLSHADRNHVNVYIGSENTVDPMRSSALVLRPISLDDKVVGAIGVIGPCRMDYSRVITTIDRVSNDIADIIGRSKLLPGGDDKKEGDG